MQPSISRVFDEEMWSLSRYCIIKIACCEFLGDRTAASKKCGSQLIEQFCKTKSDVLVREFLDIMLDKINLFTKHHYIA